MEDNRFVNFIIKKTVGHVDFDPETGFRIQTVYMTDDILREIQAEGHRYGYTDQQISDIVNATTHSINTNPSITTHYNNLNASRLEAGMHIELHFKSDKFGGTRLGLVAAGRLKFIVVESTVTGLRVNDVVVPGNIQWNANYAIEFLIYRNGNRYPDDSHSLIVENFEFYRIFKPSFIYQILDSQDDFDHDKPEISTIKVDYKKDKDAFFETNDNSAFEITDNGSETLKIALIDQYHDEILHAAKHYNKILEIEYVSGSNATEYCPGTVRKEGDHYKIVTPIVVIISIPDSTEESSKNDDEENGEVFYDPTYPIVRYAWQPSSMWPIYFSGRDLDANQSALFRIEIHNRNKAFLTINNLNPPDWHWRTSIVRRYCDYTVEESDATRFENVKEGILKRVITGAGNERWIMIEKPRVKIFEKRKGPSTTSQQEPEPTPQCNNGDSMEECIKSTSGEDKRKEKQHIPKKIPILLAIVAATLLLPYAFKGNSDNGSDVGPIMQSADTTLVDTVMTIEAIPDTTNAAINMAEPVPVIPDDFILVPAGKLKAKEVELDSFYICRHELTQGEYKQYIKELKKHNYSYDYSYDYYDNGWHVKKGITEIQEDSIPVIASYEELVEYCNKRSKADGYDGFYIISGNDITLNKNGNGYRLPTQNEWSFAAVGGAKNERYTYVGGNKMDEVGWFGGNSGYHPHKIEQKKPNSLGIYDMSGNISEMMETYAQEGKSRYISGGDYSIYVGFGPFDNSWYQYSDNIYGARLVLVPKGMKNDNLNEH